MERSYNRHSADRKHTFLPWRTITFSVLSLALIFTGVIFLLPRRQEVSASASGYTPTYLGDNARSNYNGQETVINPTSAPNLKLHWSYQAGGYISTNYITDQPVEANGLIYWGSWDGNEHATDLNGKQVWQQGLGYTYSQQCNSLTGIASTATVASVMINGKLTSIVFVGGGNGNFYALNAANGSIVWQTLLGQPPSNFIWTSPAVYNGHVYIGISSFGDCPLTPGKLFELNASTGAFQRTFNVVPPGCTGGGIWGSPTIDASTGLLYVATGNGDTCSSGTPLADALLALHMPSLSLAGSWQVPASQQVLGDDYGSTPTLFRATIGGTAYRMVGIVNANGTYYAFSRAAISSGPLWSIQIAGIGGRCGPICGDGSISPSAWDGKNLYVAGGQATIRGQSCKGSLSALNPSTGAIKWQDCFNDGPVLGAVTVVPGVAVVGEGNKLVLVATSDGHSLYSYADTHSGSNFYGAATILNGVLYIGNFDGILYAFGT